MDARTLPLPPVPAEQAALELETVLLELLMRKSSETHAHSSRVGELAREWVEHMHSRSKWLEVSANEIARSARYHDVGKVAVQNEILNKAGPLTPAEREEMNAHARIGYELFRNVSSLESVALGILHHHERWDGGGYPAGLKGQEIPFVARVIGIIDAFDAMTSNRCYQRARSPESAIEEIRLSGGTQFCPDLVEDFAEFLNARNT